MSDTTCSIKSTPNVIFFHKFFMAILFSFRVFAKRLQVWILLKSSLALVVKRRKANMISGFLLILVVTVFTATAGAL